VEEAVNILYCMIKRAEMKMEHRGKVYKELDHWYDEECQWKNKETKVTLKEYKYRDDKKSEFINDLIKQKDVKKIWEVVRNLVKKRDCNTANVSPDNWIKHFGDMFTTQEFDLSVGEVQILSPYYIEELDIYFTNQEVKNVLGV
jgi:hypothetical protein